VDLNQMTVKELRQERQACERYAASSENHRRFPHRVTDAKERTERIDVEMLRRKQAAE
jgi:hypothetical protein